MESKAAAVALRNQKAMKPKNHLRFTKEGKMNALSPPTPTTAVSKDPGRDGAHGEDREPNDGSPQRYLGWRRIRHRQQNQHIRGAVAIHAEVFALLNRVACLHTPIA